MSTKITIETDDDEVAALKEAREAANDATVANLEASEGATDGQEALRFAEAAAINTQTLILLDKQVWLKERNTQ